MWLVFGATVLIVVVLALLLGTVLLNGWKWLDWQFLTSFASRFPERAGVLPPLAGSLWLVLINLFCAVPVGVAAAVYLQEMMPRNRFYPLIMSNIRNLAGVPSIVYGILGLAVFVQFLALGRSILAGGLTLSLLVFPIVIIATSEALDAVPASLRHASFALGATRWQTVRDHVLPAAVPGILTGVILAISRVIGEAAPIIVVGAAGFVAFSPGSPMDSYTALPVQIYNWVSRPRADFQQLAAAGIVVLLGLILLVNSAAILFRNCAQRKRLWQRM
jgi:phosphate transport system permease protein